MTEAGGPGGAAKGSDTTLLPQPRGGARTWYEVLDIEEKATDADVKKAYERAIALVEGRSIGGYLMLDPMAAESARADVEAAFAILGDLDRRATYDRERGASPLERADDKGAGAAGDDAGKRGSAKPVDDETAEARAILGVSSDDAAAHEGDSGLPRRATPLKFLSPVPEAKAPGVSGIRFEPPSTDATAARESQPPTQVTQGTMPPGAAMPAPAAPPPAPPVAGGAVALPDGAIAGSVIKELRVARGLSIDDVHEATKIRKPYLRAIEEEDISGLPARVYLRGFLTQIARVLKVDRARLAEGYLAFLELKGGAPKE